MIRKIAALLALATAFLVVAVPGPSMAKQVPSSCSIEVVGDGTESLTFDASFVGVPKRGTTQLIVDGGVVSDPFTTTDVGTHEASCQILNRGGRTLFESPIVTATVVPPPATYECALTATRLSEFALQLDWSVTVTNPDGTVFDVWVDDASVGGFNIEVASNATDSVSGSLEVPDTNPFITQQYRVFAREDDGEANFCQGNGFA
jgi:hypothetical protein